MARRNGAYSAESALRHFEKILGVFPFSRLAARGPALRVYALEHSEPPQFEREFSSGADPAAVVEAAREFMQDDSLAEVDAAWDLFQYDGGWKLSPAGVIICCFGPGFENEIGDQIRIDFGNDSRYLPDPGREGGMKTGESNLRSLVHLIQEIERVAPLQRRRLWSESGESPADVILKAISA